MKVDYEELELVKQVSDAFEFLQKNRKLIPQALSILHRTRQQQVMKDVITGSIKHWAEVYNDKERVRYDLRNEATVELCAKIVKEIENLDYLPLI